MKILTIGDVYWSLGKKALDNELKNIIKEHNVDFVIMNAENFSRGRSLSEKDYKELMKLPIDCFTGGNHSMYGNKILPWSQKVDNVIIPANFNPFLNLKGTATFDVKGKSIRVTNLMGVAFMNPTPASPFSTFEEILKKNSSDIHIVDFHAEATAEKVAFALYYDGQFTALYGTHTHVQTADERILPKGTGFITDIGMTGPHDSVIGVKTDIVTKKFKTSISQPLLPETEGPYQFMGAIFNIDNKTNKVTSIERINLVQPR